jgi:hypothetical protein
MEPPSRAEGLGCQQIEGKLAMSPYRWESRVSFGCHEGTEKVAKYGKIWQNENRSPTPKNKSDFLPEAS